MKNTFVWVVVMLCTLNINAADKKNLIVPANVKAVFQKEFPGAAHIKWEKERGSYEAAFTNSGKKMSVLYSPGGIKEETEVSIPIASLPAPAKKFAEAKGKIKDAAEITRADGSTVYEAEVNGKDLIFDKNGTFIKEVKD